ncbi:AbiV family abortive infection protein [Peribacillus simplex]|uniref:AbiV family abortive infection protein n=1 Tax=Peribacillus simplex TaxID=1478 RepID=UPI00382CA52B
MNFNQLKVKDVELIYNKIFENACELIDDASLLFDNQKYARAFMCAQISVEEFGKLPTLITVALDIHNGVKVDWKKLNKKLRDHKQKTISSYLTQMLMEKILYNFDLEKLMISDEDDLEKFKVFLDGIKLNQDIIVEVLRNSKIKEQVIYSSALAEYFNNYKNHSLYADFYKDEFLKSSEVIDKKTCMGRIFMALCQKKYHGLTNIPDKGIPLYKYEDVDMDSIISDMEKNDNEE